MCQQKISATVIIVAAGSSVRMGEGIRKQYLPLRKGTVLSESIKPFLQTLDCRQIVVAIPKEDSKEIAQSAISKDTEIKQLLKNADLILVAGGDTRQQSVKIALEKVSNNHEKLVLVHDAARPFVSGEIILSVTKEAIKYGGAVPGIEVIDTHKIINSDNFIKNHLHRNEMVAIQTPQAFDFEKLLNAHRIAEKDGQEYTDDTEIFNKYIGKVFVTKGSQKNIKITYTKDIMNTQQIIRTGIGYDFHKLIYGRKLKIGGITIPFEKGEEAHSDGDVLLHAITDALLGASALGDIGSFFPPEDSKWKDADSVFLLKNVWSKIKANGWKLMNLDCIVKLEKPKFLPFRDEVIISIANTLEVEKEKVFVKAKTQEQLGDIGKGDAIEAWCSCLLTK